MDAKRRILGSDFAKNRSKTTPNDHYVQANPPDIVTIEDDEFRINMNNMEPLRRYIMKFDGSTYVVWKNGDGSLVMEEVEA